MARPSAGGGSTAPTATAMPECREMDLPSPFGPDLKVLVLAGSHPKPLTDPEVPGEREVPLADKAFQPLHRRLVVEYMLDVLRACGLTRVWLLAPERLLAGIPTRHQFTPVAQVPGASFWANLLAGAAAMNPGEGEPVLVVFGDHPITTPVALHAFLAGCASRLGEADFFHALALQRSYCEYAAWFTGTSVHAREMTGRATGLSVAVPSRLRGLPAMERLYGVRKLERIDSRISLMWHLVRWLGRDAPRGLLDTVLLSAATEMEKAARGSRIHAGLARRLEAWLSARVPIQRLERYAKRVLAAERGVRLIPISHGSLAIDVDFASDLRMLEAHWDEIVAVAERQDRAIVDATAGWVLTQAT